MCRIPQFPSINNPLNDDLLNHLNKLSIYKQNVIEVKNSLYAEYIKERLGYSIIENEKGFITYKIDGDTCFLDDLFVLKRFRNSGMGLELANQVEQIAVQNGCKRLITMASLKANGIGRSIELITKFGFLIKTSDEDQIIFVKELK